MVKEETSKKADKGVFEKLVPIFILASVLMAFAVGILWEKVNNLEGGARSTTATPTVAQAQQAQQAAKPTITQDQVKSLFSMDLVKIGDDKRKVLFVEISDPSCPYCHIASGKNSELSSQAGDRFKYVSDGGTYVPPVIEMRKLVEQGKASYVYIYTPGHGAGEMATKALYCGFEQGKYWEVHDLLYTNKGYELINNTVKNDKAKAGQLADFLKSAGVSDLKSCLEGTKYDERINSDTALARTLGVGGTPAFFINETLFSGAYSYKDMESAVTAALK